MESYFTVDLLQLPHANPSSTTECRLHHITVNVCTSYVTVMCVIIVHAALLALVLHKESATAGSVNLTFQVRSGFFSHLDILYV